QAQAVRDEAPEVLVAAVQQLLHEAVRALARGARDAGGTAVEIRAEADEMDGRAVPAVRDGDGPSVDLDPAASRQQAPIAELLKEREQPTLARQAGVGRALGERVSGVAEARPGSEQAIPRARDGLADAGTGLQVIVGGH